MNKLYKCDNCSREVPLRSRIKKGEHKGKKVCSNCYNLILKPLTSSKPKKTSYVKKKKKNASAKPDSCLDAYFEYHVNKCHRSDESNEAITATKVNIAHVWNKRHHRSVACNLENAVYLTWQEHTDFDKLLDQHRWSDLEKQFPNSWYDTCVKAANLLPQITENTKFKTLFEEYLKEHNFT